MNWTQKRAPLMVNPIMSNMMRPDEAGPGQNVQAGRKKRKRKLVCDVGLNDADYVTASMVNGKPVLCPFYRRWRSMMRRCYSAAYHARQPTYIGCTVCPEWHSFMAYRSWMMGQDWKGRELDKDIRTPGNKVYSPETCMFVTKTINLLLTDHGAKRGAYPQGVSWSAQHGKFAAYLNIHGKKKHLGLFTTVTEAEQAYLAAKADYIQSLLPGLTHEHPALIPSLRRVIGELRRQGKRIPKAVK